MIGWKWSVAEFVISSKMIAEMIGGKTIPPKWSAPKWSAGSKIYFKSSKMIGHFGGKVLYTDNSDSINKGGYSTRGVLGPYKY